MMRLATLIAGLAIVVGPAMPAAAQRLVEPSTDDCSFEKRSDDGAPCATKNGRWTMVIEDFESGFT
jgi:hypothetical protein